MIGDTFIPCCSVENCAAIQSELESLRQQHERDQRVIEAAEKLKAIVAVIAYNLPISESVARIDLNRALAEYDKAKEKS